MCVCLNNVYICVCMLEHVNIALKTGGPVFSNAGRRSWVDTNFHGESPRRNGKEGDGRGVQNRSISCFLPFKVQQKPFKVQQKKKHALPLSPGTPTTEYTRRRPSTIASRGSTVKDTGRRGARVAGLRRGEIRARDAPKTNRRS